MQNALADGCAACAEPAAVGGGAAGCCGSDTAPASAASPASPANAAAPLTGVPCSALTRRACMDAIPEVSSDADGEVVPTAPPLPLPLTAVPRGDALPTTCAARGAKARQPRRDRARGPRGAKWRDRAHAPGACVATKRRPLPCVSAAAPPCGTAPAAGARRRASDAQRARAAPAGASCGARGACGGTPAPTSRAHAVRLRVGSRPRTVRGAPCRHRRRTGPCTAWERGWSAMTLPRPGLSRSAGAQAGAPQPYAAVVLRGGARRGARATPRRRKRAGARREACRARGAPEDTPPPARLRRRRSRYASRSRRYGTCRATGCAQPGVRAVARPQTAAARGA